jgi:APA family basic amino acid/polyamine antiporter
MEPGLSRHSALGRSIGVVDAVLLGLGAMLGAGVFTALAPAAAAAGPWLPLALTLAAAVATCNAFSAADLATAHPESGGTYVYATARLGRWPGRVAGVAFVAGKTCSAAAAAGALGGYLLPRHAAAVAVLTVAVVTAVNVAGVRWTVTANRVLVAAVLAVLAFVIAAGLASPAPPPAEVAAAPAGGAYGVLTAAGLLFFAFAGYARIATLGEEVRNPGRTLRLAIPLALGVALAVYLLTALAALHALGPAGLSGSTAPLADVVAASPAARLTPMVRAGAAVAMVSVLLTVLVAISRTVLAMARRADLPRSLAAIGGRGTPWRADLAGGTVAAVVAVLAGPVAAIALSACCVLVYYAITNAAALRLPSAGRRWPRWTAYLGVAGCAVLAVSLPWQRVLTTAAVLVAGTALTGWHSRSRP